MVRVCGSDAEEEVVVLVLWKERGDQGFRKKKSDIAALASTTHASY
jgi:hypothetical protein